MSNSNGAPDPTALGSNRRFHPQPFHSVLDRICSEASAQPDAIAMISGGETITFAELVARAFALASALEPLLERAQSSVIAVSTDDPLHLALSALAAWRAGCAYLPVSPSCPAERLRHMLAESDARVVVLDGHAGLQIPSGEWRQLDLGHFATSPLAALQAACPLRPGSMSPDSPAYVIYTSGSTGRPKGVLVTHGNLSNLVSWYKDAFGVGREDRATQMRALTSDVAVMEIWGPLSQGVRVYVVERATYLVPERLRDYLVTQEITICETPTLIAEQLLDLDWPPETKLRYLQTGGETLRAFPPADLPFQTVNNFGPTECTVVSTSGVVGLRDGNSRPTIGQPITGVEVLLLDADLQPVREGERGEIFIGGAGVAAGYIGRPDLTSDRFVRIPSLGHGSRFYRTGDLARKLPNRDYEFCGRADDQIKLRGYRIEPAEIVSGLRSHPAISAAAVTTVGEGAYKLLVAHVVLKTVISGQALRDHLALLLPDYMVPDLFVRLENMPLAPHGKIDYSALPFPNRSNLLDLETSSLEPTTEIQIEVASIIATVLKRSNIGFTDNFFRLGGNSLLAAQVVVNIQRSFGVDIRVRSVFESPTVEGLAAEIEHEILAASGPVSASEVPGTTAA